MGDDVQRGHGLLGGVPRARVARDRRSRARVGEPAAHRRLGGDSDGARFWLGEQGRAAARRRSARRRRWRSPSACAPMRPPDTHPVWAPWRSLQARARSRRLGRTRRGGSARRRRTSRSRGARRRRGSSAAGLRILGEVEGAAGIDYLREATARLLDGTSARLERAKAHAALAARRGAARRRGARDRARARPPLRGARLAAALEGIGRAAPARAGGLGGRAARLGGAARKRPAEALSGRLGAARSARRAPRSARPSR